MSYHLSYLRLAYIEAEKSPDPSTQNGAILVNDEGIVVAKGHNTFCKGVSITPERLERPLKYEYIEHAERNAIYDAAREGVKTKGLVMYVPWFACADCGRAILNTGVSKVYGHMLPEHENNPRWKESIARAIEMFDEAGLEYEYVQGKIGSVSIRMNGDIVYP